MKNKEYFPASNLDLILCRINYKYFVERYVQTVTENNFHTKRINETVPQLSKKDN